MTEQLSMVWASHSLFNYSLVEEYLGYFEFGAMTNKAAMNIQVYIFVCT
jgi:hypothetical protein